MGRRLGAALLFVACSMSPPRAIEAQSSDVEARMPGAAADEGASVERRERQAVDLLLSNEFESARQLYVGLAAIAPQRPEYAAMVKILSRVLKPK
jgi:hypothetical protein